MYKKTNKVIATILLLILTLVQFSTVGTYAKEAYASNETTNKNVEFEAYFIDEEKESHFSIKNMNEVNSLYVRINVKNTGYLKDAKITFKGANNEKANFKIVNNTSENSIIQSIDEQNNEVILNQINYGTQKTIEIPISFEYSQDLLLSELSKENKVILTATYIDGQGKQQNITKEVNIRLDWTAGVDSALTVNVDKFIPYVIGSQEGIILEKTIKTSVVDNSLPIKTTTIQATVPAINGVKPTTIKVYSNSTESTNGDKTGYSFTDNNWTYDEENNQIIITVQNQVDENGKIKWAKQAQDEYKIVYIFSKEVKDYIEQTSKGEEIEFETKVILNLYDSEQTKLTRTNRQSAYYKEQEGNLVETSVKEVTKDLSKGYIYANYASTTNKNETIYNQTVSAQVSTAQLVDKIILEQNAENFITDNEKTKYPTTVSENNYTYYKNISVNKDSMNKVLGENAKIDVYSGETLLGTIDAQTTSLNIADKNVNTLKIETSKPQTEGTLIFDIEKAVKGTIGYTKAQMQSVTGIELQSDVAFINGQQEIDKQSVKAIVNFVEPQTKVDLSINKTNLSTVVKNQNVEIRAILRTDEITNNLFKNPQLTIKLPQCIEEIDIKDVQLLFDDNLKATASVVDNKDGSKWIVVKITGEQKDYTIGSTTGGANLVIVADITVNRLTSNKQETIKMSYTNENDKQKQEKEVQTAISIVAPTGVVTTNTISNYADGEQDLTSMSGEAKTAQVPTLKPSRDVKFDMTVINNYNNTINNVKILGRLPFRANKDLVTGNDLGSTFSMALKNIITTNGIDESRITIYYSTNENATQDLQNTSNGWTTTIQKYEDVKSYLIVINGQMNTADAINFSYVVNLPANLKFNETAVQNYIVYFENNLQTGTIQDKQLATPITITTGRGPVLEATLSSNYNVNQIVSLDNYIEYTLKVSNTGTETAQNVLATMQIPEYLKFYEEKQEEGKYTVDSEETQIKIELGAIETGKTIEKKILLKVADISSDDQSFVGETKTKVTLTANGIQVETNEVTNRVKKPYFRVSNSAVENYGELSEQEEFEFIVGVSTTSQGTQAQNTIVTIPLPEGLTYISNSAKTYEFISGEEKDIQINAKYDKNNNTITANIGTVKYGTTTYITIKVKVESLPKDTYKKVLSTYVNVIADGLKQETSDIKEYIVTKAGIELTQTSNIPNSSTIKAGDELIYIGTIKNIGEKDIYLTITDKLPSGLSFKDMEYTLDGETKTSTTMIEGKVITYIILPKGKTLTVKITTIASIVSENTKLVNQIVVTEDELGEVKSNEVTHTVEKTVFPDYNEEQGNQKPSVNTNRINGIVWKDENKNGIYDSNEQTIAGVPVLLLNVDTNKLFKQELITNEDGLYTFTEVPNGNYIVIFQYDASKYSATAYQVEGADQTVNSDAMDTQITLDGELINVGLTNTILVQDENVYNISLGLVDSPKFDLRLDKTISKITVQNSTGTKTYDYNNEKLAKVEFVEKYLGQTTAVIEYKISVTNEGAVEGYVKKIVDYIPDGMNFSTELNKDWYINENGAIYNSSLANTKIMPGETKQVTLTLTKLVTSTSLGTINNTAEIYEAYNDQGLEDIDSFVANKASNEDDYSTADVVFAVKTGKEIMFIGLTLSIITTIGIGAYFIKKKVLR